MGLHDDPPLDRPLTENDLGHGTNAAPQLTVEVWLPLRGATPPRMLMLRRSKSRGAFWQGVSGRVEPTDATLRDAAAREVREETGLPCEAQDFVDLRHGYAFFGTMSGRPFRKRCVALWLPEDLTPDQVQLSDEHVEARVVSFDAAQELVRYDEMKAELNALRTFGRHPR